MAEWSPLSGINHEIPAFNILKSQSHIIPDLEDRFYKGTTPWGTWVAQSVKRLTLDFGLDHDLKVCEFEPHVGLCADSADPTWDLVSPSVSVPPLLARSLEINT